MTTDVAEAPSTAVEIPVEVAPTPEPVTPSEPAGEAPVVTEESAESAPVADFDVTTLPEWQEIVKEPDPAIKQAAAAPELPGEPVVEVRERLEQQRAVRARGLMQMSNQQAVGFLVNELGFTPNDATRAWDSKLGPMFRALVSDNASYNRAVFHAAVDTQLPPEGQDAFYSQVYKDETDATKGVYTAGVAVERKAWESKLGTELFTKAQLEKATRAAYARGLSPLEEAGEIEGATSGQEPRGSAATGRSFRTLGDASKAYNNREITDVQFAREHKRLTGKLPGE